MPVVSSPNLTQTANGQDLYVLANPASGASHINGALTVSGDVSSGGNLTVGTPAANASLVVNGLATVGDGTHASQLVVNGGLHILGDSALDGAVSVGAEITLGGAILSATGSGVGAPRGLAGSRSWQVSLLGATTGQDVGLNPLANDATGHLFSALITSATGLPGVCYGLFMTFPPAANTPPEIINTGQGFNGLTWNVVGTAGAYQINVNTGTAGLYNVFVSILA